MTEATTTGTECGWVKLYTKGGALVTIPVTAEPLDYAAMLANVGKMLEAGFAVTAPGLEAGEMVEEVGWVVRGSKQGRDGVADVLYLYSTNDGWTKPFLTMYLNNAEQRAAFEHASRMKVADIPKYIGEGKLERGKNPDADALIIRAPRPFGVVMKPNPKWNQNEYNAAKANPSGKPYTVPKKVFVRWADQKPAPQGKNGTQDYLPVDIAKIKGLVDISTIDKAVEWVRANRKYPAERMKQVEDAANARETELKREFKQPEV